MGRDVASVNKLPGVIGGGSPSASEGVPLLGRTHQRSEIRTRIGQAVWNPPRPEMKEAGITPRAEPLRRVAKSRWE